MYILKEFVYLKPYIPNCMNTANIDSREFFLKQKFLTSFKSHPLLKTDGGIFKSNDLNIYLDDVASLKR